MSIMKAERAGQWTLTEAAKLLGEPQHRLIYLCEKGVIRPDFQDAEGRGSSRRFSARNLLEFAVALRLREFEIQVSLIAAVIHVLRAFDDSMRKKIKAFQLPDSVRIGKAPDLRAIISDEQCLYFSLRMGSAPAKVFGGVALGDLERMEAAGFSSRRELRIPEIRHSSQTLSEFGAPEGSKHARVEISITKIAQDLPLED